MSIKFNKPALSLPDQVAKLQRRGLVVPDPDDAIHSFQYIGYYRLSAYALSFQDCTQPGKPFRPGTNFKQVVGLYRFDRELRLLVLDAIERIEVALRSVLNNKMAMRHGPH